MQVYLPIAEMSVNIFLVLGIGIVVGWLSGLFGVGGGFLMTPLLMFLGVSPAVAVGTGANQIVASSVAGVMAHWRRGNVDVRMGMVLLVGGLVGSGIGVFLFRWLRSVGHIDLAIALCYVVFLGTIGSLMLGESLLATWRARRPGHVPRDAVQEESGHWADRLPLKMTFHRSRLYISVIPPFLVGVLVGVLAAIMGVGGGFVAVPAMIYVLRMPTQVVIGTSLFQVIFVSANTAFLQALLNQTVDVMLALTLLVGAVTGAQFGARFGSRIKAEQMRILLALLVLAVCIRLAFDLMVEPEELFILGGGG
ncbi:sulfite exporter TauE/SafE family protein [Haematospirillum jordaniae]|uniref:Probable membrane transporter protein n=1 Tax=Haematospirillum jordaniae TaxID=1549855 RepID=A0A143DC86_9PROT|nr:sulfite exporter TauE/SafE family protein [Haematospirillum jordaniae]AMW34341.1 permease [Haematospirillum jordaniae]NKD44691.1 sulfite exporter TauE/SafE family protein [Haematospirillum jordaniae]NKD57711.1 sulfite exporter TauE/SafE family protein [Haematospirillum jordaniae]NKD59281.1 sulfite exporter TauE/SafE family protein [Haematospirillum jordaniae]NKD67419.1 sulfite exporter TauE/SafE family protein [Haematospirillum jordaniae]